MDLIAQKITGTWIAFIYLICERLADKTLFENMVFNALPDYSLSLLYVPFQICRKLLKKFLN
jgi:hypothetical protein